MDGSKVIVQHSASRAKAGDLAFVDAGELARDAIGRACAADLGKVEWRVFAAVLDRTVTFSKQSDWTSSRQLAAIVYGVDREAVSGWQRRNVTRSLQVLADRGLIAYEAGSGRHARMFVTLLEGVHTDAPFPVDNAKGASVERETCVSPSRKVCQPVRNVRPYAATPSNSPSNEPRNHSSDKGASVDTPLGDEGDAQTCERVIAHVAGNGPYGSKNAKEIDRNRLHHLVALYPAAPVEMLAGAAMGEPAPYLRSFRRDDVEVAS